MVRIRAFKAIDEFDTCNLYVQEHMEVLKVFGITKITTANNSWMFNPNVYVIIAELTENNKPIGGARIHMFHKDHSLPFIDAVKDFDASVHTLVAAHDADGGTGEICGLWNSRDVAGWGIGTLFLARAGVSIANKLPMHSMFVLCGEHTIGITLNKGFTVEESLGNRGTFFYPKEGLVATAAVMSDVRDLSYALPEDRGIIESLRENPTQIRYENSPKGPLEIQYQLDIKY